MSTPENKLIYEREFAKPVAVTMSNERRGINVGGISIYDFHSQDCCETVEADWSAVASQLKSLKKINKIEIKAVSDMGIVLFFYHDQLLDNDYYNDRIGILVNCYNIQNGYYSDDLQLIIEDGGIKQEIDVSEVVYDVID